MKIGDMVLLATKNLVYIKDKTACSRLNSRYAGPFRMVPPPEEIDHKHGRSANYVWLALPLTLGRIQQPLSLSRLKRFHERPSYLGGEPAVNLPSLSLGNGDFTEALEWIRSQHESWGNSVWDTTWN